MMTEGSVIADRASSVSGTKHDVRAGVVEQRVVRDDHHRGGAPSRVPTPDRCVMRSRDAGPGWPALPPARAGHGAAVSCYRLRSTVVHADTAEAMGGMTKRTREWQKREVEQRLA
jgi:hypothetical protein